MEDKAFKKFIESEEYKEIESNNTKELNDAGIYPAGNFEGVDSISFCDSCNEEYMMSELTVLHKEDDSDFFICGNCVMNRLNNPKNHE